MSLLVTYLLMALSVSFLCSLVEAAFLSLPFSHIALLREKKTKTGILLMKQKENVSRPLTAILTLNTIAHTVGAVGVGAQVSMLYGKQWLTLASVVMTILILFLSEIIPKTIGAIYCRELSVITAYILWIMVLISFPVVIMIESLPGIFSRKARAMISREEIEALSRLATEHGSLSLDEMTVIKNLLALKTIATHQIMTPLSAVFSLPADATISLIMETHHVLPFSRIPIYSGSEDNFIGIALRIRLLMAHHKGRENETIESLSQPVSYVDENLHIAQLFNEFFKKKQHILIVRHGKKATGIVTLEDALESLLGIEIVDETDTVVDMRELAARIEKRKRPTLD